jgi:hypothetical protein
MQVVAKVGKAIVSLFLEQKHCVKSFVMEDDLCAILVPRLVPTTGGSGMPPMAWGDAYTLPSWAPGIQLRELPHLVLSGIAADHWLVEEVEVHISVEDCMVVGVAADIALGC